MRSHVLACVFLAVGLFAAVVPMPVLADPLQVFGVDVYLLSPPSCAPGGTSREVHAHASPFEPDASLAEIITELARQTREAGANTLHSIRIVSAVPFRGAEARGMAMTCRANAAPANGLAALVATSRSVDAFAIKPADPLGPVRTLANAQLTEIASLGADDLAKLKALVLQMSRSTVGPDIKSTCPFIPDFGFRFRGDEHGDQDVWLVVSAGRGCDASVVLRRDDDWRKTPSTNLSAEMVSQLKAFAKR
jgi:hypothetical protein